MIVNLTKQDVNRGSNMKISTFMMNQMQRRTRRSSITMMNDIKIFDMYYKIQSNSSFIIKVKSNG